jgi:hypothetical protein
MMEIVQLGLGPPLQSVEAHGDFVVSDGSSNHGVNVAVSTRVERKAAVPSPSVHGTGRSCPLHSSDSMTPNGPAIALFAAIVGNTVVPGL